MSASDNGVDKEYTEHLHGNLPPHYPHEYHQPGHQPHQW